MRTYDKAYATARPTPPFANGTEGYAWMANWCDRCVHDAAYRTGDGTGCPLVQVALMDRTPIEWVDQTAGGHRLGDTYHCTEFRDDDGGDDGDPEPEPPVIDGQSDIFAAFADHIAEASRELPQVAEQGVWR